MALALLLVALLLPRLTCPFEAGTSAVGGEHVACVTHSPGPDLARGIAANKDQARTQSEASPKADGIVLAVVDDGAKPVAREAARDRAISYQALSIAGPARDFAVFLI